MQAATPISPTLPGALSMALDDEYRARATYQAVLARFGPVRPFANIASAEQRHIDALWPLFDRYGLQPPADRWSGQVMAPDTLAQSCAAGASAEIRNYQMYDWLLTQVAEPDVRAVFGSLRNASANHHLPAFQSCATADARTAPIPPVNAPPPANRTSWLPWLGLALGAGAVLWLNRRTREV